ncbi:MAG: metal-sensitive transcriptional regulator [Candidatus Omnitrophica bacterium]|nr:metal-sensitive transcriptional regulator [Candidatus Omnitrophota bacterium]
MSAHPDHSSNLVALKRIEGQVRGLQKMIEEKRYCVDILTQITSVNGALLRVQDKILEAHMNSCLNNALKGKSEAERHKKISEMFALLKKYRKNG